MEKYEVDGNCLIIFENCHDINGNNSSSSNNGTDNYDPFGNEMEMTTKQRSQANARERFRTHRFIESFSSSLTTSLATKKLNQDLKNFSHHSVNSAFNTLRLLIPTEPKNRKLSKIETLRLAKSYISHLNATLATGKFCAEMIYCFFFFLLFHCCNYFHFSFSPFSLLKEMLHVDNHALEHQLYISNGSSISIKNNMIIVQISAHSVYPQSFIKRGLIKDYL